MILSVYKHSFWSFFALSNEIWPHAFVTTSSTKAKTHVIQQEMFKLRLMSHTKLYVLNYNQTNCITPLDSYADSLGLLYTRQTFDTCD